MTVRKFRGVIFDVDGVLIWQGKVCPGAHETIDSLRKKGTVIRFLTNSTLRSRKSTAEKLQAVGIKAYEDEVITASSATARYLKEINPHSVLVMLEDRGMEEFADFEQDWDNPEYIVIGDNRSRFDFENLNRITALLLKGSKLIGMTDGLIEHSMGRVELNVGSWVGMLERAAGIKAKYIGKPQPFMFELSLKTMGLNRDEVLMVGDTPAVDIQGAKNTGIRSALIKQGEYLKTTPGEYPEADFEFNNIKEVCELF